MRFVDEYRAPEQVMQLVEHLRLRARLLPHTAKRPLRIMEVCGGHTHDCSTGATDPDSGGDGRRSSPPFHLFPK